MIVKPHRSHVFLHVSLKNLWRSPPSDHPAPENPKHPHALCIAAVVALVVSEFLIFTIVKFHSGLRKMPSPSLRCQARRPQSKKVRLAVVLPSGLDV